MATPMEAARFSGHLKDHVKIQPVAGWENHNRGLRGDGWGPVNGVMIHHYGPYSTIAGAVSYASTGSAALPGPLYNVLVDRAGVAHLIGWGRANHAGTGDQRVLEALIAERLPFPAPRYAEGEAGGIDMNARVYGICLLNRGDGKQTYPAVQLETAAWASAVICAYHGWSERSVIAHKESQRGKVDPSLSMSTFRPLVKKHIPNAG